MKRQDSAGHVEDVSKYSIFPPQESSLPTRQPIGASHYVAYSAEANLAPANLNNTESSHQRQ